ncbi:hypothetical protein PVAP13_2KG193082 [Panicum virgatum]|uniref:Uncharacterized protein n=1 Tax=Panicum virgatum TaxID=38727 RepID=A0A8T0WD47_PANVG|nr:hypothetical protein PVAP13_2KG193082 [Panicum virgatum]
MVSSQQRRQETPGRPPHSLDAMGRRAASSGFSHFSHFAASTPPGCRISPPPPSSCASFVLSSAHTRATASSAVRSNAPALAPPHSSPPPSPTPPHPPPPAQAPPQSTPAVLRYILGVLSAAREGSAALLSSALAYAAASSSTRPGAAAVHTGRAPVHPRHPLHRTRRIRVILSAATPRLIRAVGALAQPPPVDPRHRDRGQRRAPPTRPSSGQERLPRAVTSSPPAHLLRPAATKT